MFVTFSWPSAPRALDKSAEAIAQAIKASGRLVGFLKPLTSVQGLDPALESSEVLKMEFQGLSYDFYPMPIWGVYNISLWQKIEDVAGLLREFVGVEPRVLINGDQSVLSYAAQEENRARYFRQALESARQDLMGTRTWIKDPRLARIRMYIDDCFRHESGVEVVGYRRVEVEPEA